MPTNSSIQIKKKSQQATSRKEWRRLQKLNVFEVAAREKGFSILAGIDEAGRGPLAGPVVAAACIIPEDVFVIGVNDSKLLTPKQRCEIYEQIVSNSRIQYGVGIVCNKEIDQLNILQATIKAMLLAIAQLPVQPELLLVDGLNLLHPSIPCEKINQGDSKSHTIASASIIAKETRDRLMVNYHKTFPHYGFDKHKGYGTPEHLEALKKHGPCDLHRHSFAPVKNFTTELTEITESTEKKRR